MNLINQQEEITMIATPRTCNTLNHAEVYKLTRWVEINQATLKGKTQDSIAQDASEGTGLKVTINNIQAVSKTLGIPLHSHANKKVGIPTDINKAMARAVRNLYQNLGEEVPSDILLIATR